ncbi:MAG: sensor domain-containing diguanylate cyclase [Aquabacterium sp.]
MSKSEMPYPTPIHEEQRLRHLQSHEIVNTPPEAEFDALARLAASVCHAPVATLSLVDADRVWFKASQGVALPHVARNDAPEAHAIAVPHEVLVVTDMRLDTRFAHNPLVTKAPQLRFHASAVIADEKGLPLGCLSVADTRVRSLDAAQRQSLKDLATLAAMSLSNRARGRELSRMAKTDPLTGLSNRIQFQLALEVELAHAMRTGEVFTALRMDLDGFKDVTDGFGHAAAEEVLREVSRRLKQQVRLGDVLARFDGDEFGVVMRHGGTESAQILAKRIVKQVSAPITLPSGDVIGVGISVGMAAYSDAVESVETLLAQTDQALFDAKKQNERRWKMFVGIR